MAIQVGQVLMVHAGVLPQWSATKTMALAGEVQAVLRSDDWMQFMPQMYGGLPNVWRDDLVGADRLRVIVNALTRLRFCDAQGAMDFSLKASADKAPPHLMPWFDVPGRLTADVRIAFGHWSTVQTVARNDVLCLDDGCLWGGCLTAAKLEASVINSQRGRGTCVGVPECDVSANHEPLGLIRLVKSRGAVQLPLPTRHSFFDELRNDTTGLREMSLFRMGKRDIAFKVWRDNLCGL